MNELMTMAIETIKNYNDHKFTSTSVNSVCVMDDDKLVVATFGDCEIKARVLALPQGEKVVDSALMIEELAYACEFYTWVDIRNKIAILADRNLEKGLNADEKRYYSFLKEVEKDLTSRNISTIGNLTHLLTFAMGINKHISVNSETGNFIDTIGKKDFDKKAFNKYMTDMINVLSCPYIKNSKCELNNDEINNLAKIRDVYTRKWTKNGIVRKSQDKTEVFKQILLAIFESEYKLEVVPKSKKIDFTLSF